MWLRRILAGLVVLLLIVGVCFWALRDDPTKPTPSPLLTEPEQKKTEAPLLDEQKVFIDVADEEGQPIPGASIQLVAKRKSPRALTDETGIATLTRREPTLLLRVNAAGFETYQENTPNMPTEGDFSWSVVLKRQANSNNEGHSVFVYCDAKPESGAAVVIFDKKGNALHAALTKASGEAILDVMDPAHKVRAYSLQCAPQTKSAREAQRFDLVRGGRFSIKVNAKNANEVPDFSLLVQRQKVVFPFRKTRRRYFAAFRAGARSPLTPSTELEEKDGRFLSDPFAEADYLLTITADGYSPVTREARTESGAITTIDFELDQAASVVGDITDEKGAPLKGALVRLRVPSRGAGFARARTDENGHFTASTMANKRHTLIVSKKGYSTRNIAAIEVGKGDVHDVGTLALRKLKKGEVPQTDYVGIGATLKIDDEGARIDETLPGGAAANLLSNDDRIVQVDGVWIQGLTLTEVVERIVGNPDTEVELLVESIKSGERRTEVLARKRINYTPKRRKGLHR